MADPGGVPEWPKGTGCKPVGSAYGGSNPPAPISPGKASIGGYGHDVVWARVALALFVVAWVLDVSGLRWVVPLWLPFLVAFGLELSYFIGAWRDLPVGERDAGPQAVDLERYGELETEDDEWPSLYVPVRRPVRRFLVGAGLIAALAALVWFVQANSGWQGVDPDEREAAVARFSAESSRIVGRPVEIRCDERGQFVGAVQDADGVAVVGGRLAYLTPARCYDLYRLEHDGHVSFSQTGRALAVLAHESWHLRGESNEGITECFAFQSGVGLGERLGLDESTARRMMRQQLVENAQRAGGDAEYLVPPECRDGGELDLDPNTSDFP
jgi:hypothetical protein